MKKNFKVLIGIVIAAVLGVGLAVYFLFLRPYVSENEIKGTVTEVIDKPNLAENGYYGITVQDEMGKQYKINATGYRNMPARPDMLGDACVDVPMLKQGDKIAFNLPRYDGQGSDFDICYKKDTNGYYMRVN